MIADRVTLKWLQAIVILLLQGAAVLLAMWTAPSMYFAMMFRFDSSDELECIKQQDVILGAQMGFAVELFLIPLCWRKPKQCLLVFALAASTWLCISGGLIHHHNEVNRIRSCHWRPQVE